jgi:hypothetical protein
VADKETARMVFSGRQIFAVVVLPVPLCHERIGANREFIEFGFLVQNAYELSIRIVNAQTDCSLQWRRQKTDADSAGR